MKFCKLLFIFLPVLLLTASLSNQVFAQNKKSFLNALDVSLDNGREKYFKKNKIREKHLKYKFVQVDTSFLLDDEFVKITLFNNKVVTAKRENLYKNDSDYWVWSGPISDEKASGYANFICKKGRLRGSISYDKKVYLIRSFPDRSHIFHEASEDRLDNECDTPIGTTEYSNSVIPDGQFKDHIKGGIESENARTEDVCYSIFPFNVLLAYTPQFASLFIDRESLYLHLHEIIESLNLVYLNSGQDLRAKLVFAYQTLDSEVGNKDVDLDERFALYSDGYFDEVFNYREEFRADVCILLIQAPLGGKADRERKMGIYSRQGSGFPDTDLDGYGVAHEIGHMQNLEHNREEYYFERAALDFKKAYGKLGNNWRTVMSYVSSSEGNEPKVPYFSGDYPERFTFPDGESLGTTYAQAVRYLRDNENRVQQAYFTFDDGNYNSHHLPLTETLSLNTGVGSYSIIAAKETIILEPGFEVQAGSEFSALIRDCIHHDPDFVSRGGSPSNSIVNSKSGDEDNLTEETYQPANVLIYPNPSSGIITMRIPNYASNFTSIKVLDVGNHILYEKEDMTVSRKEISFDLSHFPSGTYFVRMTTADDVFVERVIFYR